MSYAARTRTCLLSVLWLAAMGIGVLAVEGAARREWSGSNGNDPNWSKPGNWTPAGVPQDGDDLIFRETAENPGLRRDMINDLVDLRVRRLEFCDNGWSLDGNELTLLERVGNATNPSPCGPISFTFDCPLKIGGPTLMIIPEAGGSLILRGNIDLNGNDLRLTSGERIIVSGQISGTGNIFATLDGFDIASSITFNGSAGNTFSGRLTIRQLYHQIGQVVFDKQSGVVVNDALLIGDSMFSPSADRAVCKLARPHQIGDLATVCIAGGGQFLLEGHTETFGSLCLTNSAGDAMPSLVDTGGATLSVLGDITAVNDAAAVIPTIRGLLGLPGPSSTLRRAKDAAP